MVFGVKGAAKACLVSEKTIRRRLGELAENGATMDSDSGAWQIPLHALLAVGLTPGKPTPGDPDAPVAAPAPAAAPESVTVPVQQSTHHLVDVLSARAPQQEVAERVQLTQIVTVPMDEWKSLTTAAGELAAARAENVWLREIIMMQKALEPAPAPAPSLPAIPEPRRRWWQFMRSA